MALLASVEVLEKAEHSDQDNDCPDEQSEDELGEQIDIDIALLVLNVGIQHMRNVRSFVMMMFGHFIVPRAVQPASKLIKGRSKLESSFSNLCRRLDSLRH